MNTFFNWLEHLFKPEPFLGVLEDTRSEQEKQNDPLHEEVAAGIPIVTWTEKPPEQWKSYTLRTQNLASYDCCAFSTTTGVQADRGLNFPLSAADIYARRSNYQNPGMIPFESVSIPTYIGVIPDSMLPSDNLTEDQLNSIPPRTPEMTQQAMQYANGIPTKITNVDIDTIASLISQGMTVRLAFQFSQKEWTAIPQLIYKGSIRHQVIGVDFAIVNGKKCIIIQDSCFPNTTYVFPHGLRAITEDFLLQRCFAANYIKPTTPQPVQPLSPHKFTVDIGYGESNAEVVSLQARLQTLGFFPNSIQPTGYFGGLTKQAVIAFQTAHNIPSTGYVGPLTRAQLNTLS